MGNGLIGGALAMFIWKETEENHENRKLQWPVLEQQVCYPLFSHTECHFE